MESNFIQPAIVSTHFHLRPGDSVGDFGSGAGNFTAVLSRLVGAEGRVYACEIQKNLAEKLADKIRRERLGNVEVVWGDLEEPRGTRLDDGSLDAAVIINALFQMENRAGAIEETVRTLRTGGKLFIIDWSESWNGMGPPPGHVLSRDEAMSLAESAGLTFEREFTAGSHHYGLAFRK